MMDVLTLVPLNTQNPDDNEEIEIDIDKIDDATLRFLDNFVKEVKCLVSILLDSPHKPLQALAKKKKKTA